MHIFENQVHVNTDDKFKVPKKFTVSNMHNEIPQIYPINITEEYLISFPNESPTKEDTPMGNTQNIVGKITDNKDTNTIGTHQQFPPISTYGDNDDRIMNDDLEDLLDIIPDYDPFNQSYYISHTYKQNEVKNKDQPIEENFHLLLTDIFTTLF